METTQLTQMVNWLDEELRRERAELAQLQGVVERQATEAVEQARQIKELEGRLASTQAQLVRFARFEETLNQFKSEIVLMLDGHEEQIRREQREAERLRMSDREAQAKAVSEVRKELPRFAPLEEALRQREAEDRRLGEVVMSLRQDITAVSKSIDERVRNITYLIDQRAHDNKRLSGLQEESLALLKRTEAQETKLTGLEDRSQRHERVLQELSQLVTEIKREQTDWMQRQLLAVEERKREMVEWREEVEAQRSDVKEILAKMQTFTDAAAEGRRAMAGLEAFQEGLRRDQNQVAELQRLAEERQRREMDEWQAEDEKRWKKHEMQWEHQWKEQYQRHNELVSRLAQLDEELRTEQELMAPLWRLQEVSNSFRLAELQRWQAEVEKAVSEREQILRKRGKQKGK